MTNNTENSAFPQSRLDRSGLLLMVENFGGLSKREYFIAKALQGLCANANFEIINVGEVASLAIEVTDNLLEKLGGE